MIGEGSEYLISIQRQRALVGGVILMLEHFTRWKEGIRIEVGLASNVSTCYGVRAVQDPRITRQHE
eukprot:scaffold619_cov150-Skeletonema_menzelii.AAC.20